MGKKKEAGQSAFRYSPPPAKSNVLHYFEPTRPGDWIMVMVPHFWAKGPTFEKAVKKLDTLAFKAWKHYGEKERAVFSIHPDTVCEEVFGNPRYPIGHPPVRLDQ